MWQPTTQCTGFILLLFQFFHSDFAPLLIKCDTICPDMISAFIPQIFIIAAVMDLGQCLRAGGIKIGNPVGAFQFKNHALIGVIRFDYQVCKSFAGFAIGAHTPRTVADQQSEQQKMVGVFFLLFRAFNIKYADGIRKDSRQALFNFGDVAFRKRFPQALQHIGIFQDRVVEQLLYLELIDLPNFFIRYFETIDPPGTTFRPSSDTLS